jgi:hypothetical protein
MSFVIAAPEYVAAAATDLSNIGSAIGSANMAALGPTSNIVAAGADEVSAQVAALFGAHAQVYQSLRAGPAGPAGQGKTSGRGVSVARAGPVDSWAVTAARRG